MQQPPLFLTYAKFPSEKEAGELTGFLSAHQVPFIIEQDKTVLDKIYIGESFDPMTLLKIRSTDFERVNELVITDLVIDDSQVGKDYYLFQFSNEELLNVVHTPGEWNYFDRALAKKLLSERQVAVHGQTTSPDTQVYEPARLTKDRLVMQYLIAILLPLTGILIGYMTIKATQTLPNGQSVKMYDKDTRAHAQVILFIGLAWLVLFLWRFFF